MDAGVNCKPQEIVPLRYRRMLLELHVGIKGFNHELALLVDKKANVGSDEGLVNTHHRRILWN